MAELPRSAWAVVGTLSLRLGLALLAGWAIIVSFLFGGAMVVFWDNFKLSNFWHLFVIGYTALFAGLAVGTFIRYVLVPGPESAACTFVSSVFAIGTIAVWTADLSRGLIH